MLWRTSRWSFVSIHRVTNHTLFLWKSKNITTVFKLSAFIDSARTDRRRAGSRIGRLNTKRVCVCCVWGCGKETSPLFLLNWASRRHTLIISTAGTGGRPSRRWRLELDWQAHGHTHTQKGRMEKSEIRHTHTQVYTHASALANGQC